MSRILVCGNFGKRCQANGQTARTIAVTDTLRKIYGKEYEIITVDTHTINPMSAITYLKSAVTADKIVILPAQRALRAVIRSLSMMNALEKTTYVVIGGWLYENIKDDSGMINLLRSVKHLLVQNPTLMKNLRGLDIKADVLCNFRIYKRPVDINEDNRTDKFVYYSRVCKDKGVEICIDAVNSINNSGDKRVELDIYGPIPADYEKAFFEKLRDADGVKYCGVLDGNENILETLSLYKAMLFPTYYAGEGYPGAVLEAISSGTPVIASDWKYNSEIITHDKCGVLIKVKSTDDLKDHILEFYNNDDLVAELRENCKKASVKYSQAEAEIILREFV